MMICLFVKIQCHNVVDTERDGQMDRNGIIVFALCVLVQLHAVRTYVHIQCSMDNPVGECQSQTRSVRSFWSLLHHKMM